MIEKYFEKIEKIINSFNEITDNYSTRKKIYNDSQGLIFGEIIFKNEFTLSFLELIDTSQKKKIKYKYHFMNSEKELIFRYDNSKNHPNLLNFPHHVHLQNEISASSEPDFFDILIEIRDSIWTNNS